MLPALAEARILEFATHVRPALLINWSAFRYDRTRRVLRINGLYRHGFLLAPNVVEEAMSLLSTPGENRLPGRWNCLHEERSSTPFDLSHEAPETRLVISGNGLANPLWRQMLADELSRPLIQGTDKHASKRAGVGAAAIGGIGANILKDYFDMGCIQAGSPVLQISPPTDFNQCRFLMIVPNSARLSTPSTRLPLIKD